MFRRIALRRCAAARGPFDPYKILGLTPQASKEEIKKAYHRLALRFHPDGGPEGNAARFNAVNEAYQALKDGKWDKADQQRRWQQAASAGEAGAGWDASMRMYVYEKPGSTRESYVSGQTERSLRIFMIACFAFVFVRMFLWRRQSTDSSPTGMGEQEGTTMERDSSADAATALSSSSVSTEHRPLSMEGQAERREEQWFASHEPERRAGETTVPWEASHTAYNDPLSRPGK